MISQDSIPRSNASIRAGLGLPTSTTDNAAIRADGTSGGMQDSGVIIADDNDVSGVVDLTITGNYSQTGATTGSTGTGTQTLNGNVVVTTGKTITAVSGIIFSNETLSQYDEGTWTPTIFGSGTAGTPTYSDQSGTYTRIGRDCLFQYRVAITAKTGIAGNIAIGGLPFTINASFNASLGIGYYAGLTFGAGRTQLIGLGIAGTTSFLLQACGSAVAAASITDADIAASTELIGFFHFRI